MLVRPSRHDIGVPWAAEVTRSGNRQGPGTPLPGTAGTTVQSHESAAAIDASSDLTAASTEELFVAAM